MVSLTNKGGASMESMNLGMLIVSSIGAIGLIQTILWTFVVIRNPSFDYLRPELGQPSSTQSSAPAKE
jgi:hypothetical protein